MRPEFLKDEFGLFCEVYEIDGALRVRLSKIYKKSGLSAVEIELHDLRHEGLLKNDQDHLLAMAGSQVTVSKLHPDEVRRSRASHVAKIMFKKLFGMDNQEREGD